MELSNPSFTWRSAKDWMIGRFIRISAWLSIAIMFLILVFIAKEAVPLFYEPESVAEVGWGRLFLPQNYGTPEAPLKYSWHPVSVEPKYSLMPIILGSLKVTLIAMIFSVPISLAAALYTAEFASRWIRETIKPIVELLAGFPSVVLGFFALIVLASWLQDLFNFDYRLNAIVAGLALSLAVVPIIFTVCEDALSAVPRRLREASWALGATRAETAMRVVLPAAMPGIFAAIVLGFGRAVGETMIVLMASGNAAITSWSFTDSTRTLPATIAAELAEVVFGSPHYRVLSFIGLLLFLITFGLNSTGAWVIGRLKRRLLGETQMQKAGRVVFGRAMLWLAALAGVSIIAILAIMLGIISYNGWERLSWQFLTAPPSEGMTSGGVFPAIFGTAALVVLMSIFVAPAGVLVAIYFSDGSSPAAEGEDPPEVPD